MWTIVKVLLLFTIVDFIMVDATSCNSSTYGTEFYFGIMEAIDECCHKSNNKVIVYITNVSPNTTEVRIQVPSGGVEKRLILSPGTRSTFDVYPKIQMQGIFQSVRGIRISSDHAISVLVSNAFNSRNSIDSYNVLPVSSVGTEYLISTFGNNNNEDRSSEIMVAGIYNNTNVTLYEGSRFAYTTIINSFEVLQYRKPHVDLIGYSLKSDKGVFVTAGAAFVRIPDQGYTNDYIASEIYPVNTWSKSFIVPPILPRRLFYLRFMSSHPTSVDIRNGSVFFSVTTSDREVEFGTLPVSITAKAPIMISQFGTSGGFDNTPGDPFMTIVPPIDQYINELRFNVPDETYGAKPHMTVIIPKIYSTGLRMDSKNLLSSVRNITQLPVSAPFSNYTVLAFSATSGYHHIYHPTEDARFCVLVIGTGYELTYGFYPGFNLNGSCSEPGPTTYTTQTTTEPYRTTQSWHNTTHQFTQCYSCEDMTHIELCDTVKQCRHGEMCFLERQTKSGRKVYRSGCLAEEICAHQQNDHSDTCVECCHGNYCNNKGCGDLGFPERPRRGPVCFDCQHVLSPEECTTVMMCDPTQICRIEEYQWGDHSSYKMGCAYELCDPLKRSVLKRESRSLPVCHGCCEDDFCNRNCTITKNGPNVIVG